LKSKQRQPEQKLLSMLAYLSFVVSFFISFCCFLIWVQKTALIFIYARKKLIKLGVELIRLIKLHWVDVWLIELD
jgi:hypothetical protein